MKSQLIIVAVCLLVVMPCVAVAQTPRATRASVATEPPPQHAFANTSQPDGVIARLFAFQPAIPLGPVDVAQGIARQAPPRPAQPRQQHEGLGDGGL